MLVLSRTKEKGKDTIRYRVPPSDKEVVIDVVVTHVQGSKVRLGSVAPSDVVVARLEVDRQNAA